ncbi:MAG: hypothetical protein ACFFHV_11285 [Promethearchaeota archaeon]
MIKENSFKFENLLNDVVIECPLCHTKKKLKIPLKIINQSKQLTTISVPKGLVCDHNFQAFIDKNFIVRGYQKVDFELSKMEFYESGINSIIAELEKKQNMEEQIVNLSSLPIFQKIINLLRNYVNNDEILGSALFTIEGRVLYSSLPLSTLHNTIREFEVRNEENLIQVEKYFLVLANKQKIFSQFIDIGRFSLILTLIFSGKVQLGMGDLHLRELKKQIHKINLSLSEKKGDKT